MADLVLRNLRLAGRADITRLARQLYRTEDKLERVLQEVEQLRDEVARDRGAPREPGVRRRVTPEPEESPDEPSREPDHV
jgi:HEPN domain-containing protein